MTTTKADITSPGGLSVASSTQYSPGVSSQTKLQKAIAKMIKEAKAEEKREIDALNQKNDKLRIEKANLEDKIECLKREKDNLSDEIERMRMYAESLEQFGNQILDVAGQIRGSNAADGEQNDAEGKHDDNQTLSESDSEE